MGYVPGFANDVFLSYAHGDDPTWIQAFEQSLGRAVRDRLGQEVQVWQDLKRLRVGNDWQTEIGEAITSAAAFVAILSPSYQNSDYCSRELTRFLAPNGSVDSIKIGDLYRFLKIVRIPWENNDHESFYPDLQFLPFFKKMDGPEEFAGLRPNSDEFNDAVVKVAASVANLLRTMRRGLQMVFVASPADDVLDPWTAVRSQLRDDKYDVRPDGRLNAGYADKVILRDVDKAVLTVHLLGPSYDAFAERQMKLASDAGKRQLIWFAKGTDQEAQVEPRQWKLLDSIRKRDGLAANFDWLSGTVREMIAVLQGTLRPKPAEIPVSAGASARIYLLHDPTTRSDAVFAQQIQSEIQGKEKMEVVFPPSGATSRAVHEQLLQSSDGLLLYWDQAPETWFDQYVKDVLFLGKKAKVRSKVCLLNDPSQLEGYPIPIIRKSQEFKIADLEPFMKPLR